MSGVMEEFGPCTLKLRPAGSRLLYYALKEYAQRTRSELSRWEAEGLMQILWSTVRRIESYEPPAKPKRKKGGSR